mgnify:FL=1
MKAKLEINGDGILVTAETEEESRRLLNLWIDGVRTISMDGQGDQLLIVPSALDEG